MANQMRDQIPLRAQVKEHTVQQPARFTLEWTLEKLSAHETNSSETFLSKGITMSELGLSCDCKGRWCIALTPCHKISKENVAEEKYVSLYLHLVREPSSKARSWSWYNGSNGSVFGAEFRFNLMKGKRLIGTADWTQIRPFSEQAGSWGYEKFCEHGRVFRTPEHVDGGLILVDGSLIAENTITVTAEVIVYHKAQPKTIHILKPAAPQIKTPDISSVYQAAMKRQMAFWERVASHQNSCDFSIHSSDGKAFATNRFILMAHSPVFEAMLSYDSVEKTTGVCVMDDADSEAVEVLLDYLYGCETKKINQINAEKTLIISDKYQVMGLFPICEKFLAENISVQNAAHYLVLASQRGLDILKQAALKYINRDNMTAVLGGGGAKELAEYDPQLVQLVMEQCI